jgi:hypothetical protein
MDPTQQQDDPNQAGQPGMGGWLSQMIHNIAMAHGGTAPPGIGTPQPGQTPIGQSGVSPPGMTPPTPPSQQGPITTIPRPPFQNQTAMHNMSGQMSDISSSQGPQGSAIAPPGPGGPAPPGMGLGGRTPPMGGGQPMQQQPTPAFRQPFQPQPVVDQSPKYHVPDPPTIDDAMEFARQISGALPNSREVKDAFSLLTDQWKTQVGFVEKSNSSRDYSKAISANNRAGLEAAKLGEKEEALHAREADKAAERDLKGDLASDSTDAKAKAAEEKAFNTQMDLHTKHIDKLTETGASPDDIVRAMDAQAALIAKHKNIDVAGAKKYLKEHPETADQFDELFGMSGYSKQILGQ